MLEGKFSGIQQCPEQVLEHFGSIDCRCAGQLSDDCGLFVSGWLSGERRLKEFFDYPVICGAAAEQSLEAAVGRSNSGGETIAVLQMQELWQCDIS